MAKYRFERIIPDTSILIDGILSEMIKKGELDVDEIIIHEASIAELEHQANQGREVGFLGLEEIKRLRKLSEEGKFILKISGRRPTLQEIKLAKSGEIDSMIRSLAIDLDATLVTADRVQAEVAEAYGLNVLYLGKKKEHLEEKLTFEKWFDEETASLHIKENCKILRKKGKPGEWVLEELDTVLSGKEVEEIALEIIEAAKTRVDGFIEISRSGSTIVQLGNYRIVIVKPPVSDGWEITIVKPLKKLSIEDYNLDKRLLKRLKEKAEGIIIAGPPGHGKTTFAQALAEWYSLMGKIVKTVESPRDLNVRDIITQYSKNFASSEEIHDILLLTRPDYVIFDEMRDTPDFNIFVDLRLAGIGMVGVLHATEPIEAVQRFLTRLDVGLIPQIVDTILFIRKGKIEKVYELRLVVKVPTGMTSEDLARPVVEILDFFTKRLEYEIYVFGEETVVVPVSKVQKKKGPIITLLERFLEKRFRKFLRTRKVKVEVVSDNKIILRVPESLRPKIIGKRGKTIESFEKAFGIKIEVRPYEEEELDFEIEEGSKHIKIYVDPELEGETVEIYIGKDKIIELEVGKNGEIIISKGNSLAKKILKALMSGKEIKIYRKGR